MRDCALASASDLLDMGCHLFAKLCENLLPRVELFSAHLQNPRRRRFACQNLFLELGIEGEGFGRLATGRVAAEEALRRRRLRNCR